MPAAWAFIYLVAFKAFFDLAYRKDISMVAAALAAVAIAGIEHAAYFWFPRPQSHVSNVRLALAGPRLIAATMLSRFAAAYVIALLALLLILFGFSKDLYHAHFSWRGLIRADERFFSGLLTAAALLAPVMAIRLAALSVAIWAEARERTR